MPTRESRGPYQKGVEMRARIIDAALDAYARSDSRGPALRAIAQEVGLTDKGLGHYFSNREELMLAVLEERDRADRISLNREDPDFLAHVVEHIASRNVSRPGLVKLYLDMAVAASDPTHVAHQFFLHRYDVLRGRIEDSLISRGASAAVAKWQAPALLAAADGIQIQWLLDPSIDLPLVAVRLARLIEAEGTRPADR